MSLPAPVPGHRARTDLRTVIIAVIVGALTLGVVVVGGRLIAGDVNYAVDQAVERLYYEPPSDQWVSGAVQQWSTTIDPEASIFTSPDHLFSVKTAGDNAQASTLTAYTMDGSGLSQAWTATVDTSGDSVANSNADNNPKIYPSFLVWGKNTLIHGRTLYDITTGTTSDAPWPTDAVPVVAKDAVIACQQTTCAGYHEGDTEPAWSSAIHDPIESPSNRTDVALSITTSGNNYEKVHTLSGSNYVIVAYRHVLNIDTGEVISLAMPEKDRIADYAVTNTDEGWALLSKVGPKDFHISFYKATGGEATSTHTTKRGDGNTRPIYFPRSRPAKDIQTLWVNDDASSIAGISEFAVENQKQCTQSLAMSNGATIDLSGLDKNTFPCLDWVTTKASDNAAVVTVGMRQVTNAEPFSLMYNTTTGEQVTFEGMDPSSGAAFTTVSPKQIIGYSPADGTLISYTPKSDQ